MGSAVLLELNEDQRIVPSGPVFRFLATGFLSVSRRAIENPLQEISNR